MTNPDLRMMLRVFGRIGLLSFGGPAAQIALMHRELVDDRRWMSEAQFLRALSFCMLLPGPEAMQLATYAGWRLRGVPGGLLAGSLFVLPGAAVILVLAAIYALFGAVPVVQAAFLGIQATVVVIVLQALLRLSRKALTGPLHWGLAALSFIGIFALQLPFPLIIAGAALIGFMTADGKAPAASAPPIPTPWPTLATLAVLWALPVLGLWAFGPQILADIALFFSKLAVVTFGGAYAVLAYMTQEVVTANNWLTTPEMMDGLGLAETTPGPLILVTEFVGFLAGFKAGGWGLALAATALTLWVTFLPCFLWIFAGAPFIDRLAGQPRLAGALSGVTAAVVGVIVNLSLWFATHVFFANVGVYTTGPVFMIAPDWGSLNPVALGLCALSALLLTWRKWPLPGVLAVMAAAGAVAGQI